MAVAGSIPKGSILSGKYKVGRELGRGGMAAVYEAVNVDIGKRVAIKLLAGHLATSQTVVERFLREARAVARIHSPHICDIYDSGRLEEGTPFLVLELLEGESLYDAMCRDRQMSPEATLAIILQASRGLQKAHENEIVHRDLKPENIFLTRDQDGHLLVKILDFGLAKFYDPVRPTGKGKSARLTREGAVFGTPAYMSPEQVRGQAAADTRADLWALACITYECFTGTTVWSTDDGVAMTFAQIATAPLPDPAVYRPDLPKSFSEWFQKALDRDIDSRYQTVRELADGLAAAFGYEDMSGLDTGLIHEMSSRAVGNEPAAVSSRASAPSSSGHRLPPPPQQPSASPSPVELEQELADIAASSAPPRSGLKAVIATLVGLAGVAAAVVFLSEEPAVVPPLQKVGPTVRVLAQQEPDEASGFKYISNHPWLPLAREAQSLVAQGELERALATLRRIHEQHRHGAVRNLMDQVQVAMVAEKGKSKCQVTGLARPRRYDLVDEDKEAVDASAPNIAQGLEGAMITWTDAHDGNARAYAVSLDEAMRNRSLPVDISPEGTRVSTPGLLPVADRYLAAYADASGSKPGVYLRWLNNQAVIAGAPIAVTEEASEVSHAHAARGAGDGFLLAWAQRLEADSVDLLFRRHGPQGKPRGKPVRLTDFLNRGVSPTKVTDVQVAEAAGKLHFAYIVQARGLKQLRYIAVDATVAAPGLEEPPPGRRQERTLGEEITVTPPSHQVDAPSLACVPDGCFIAWNQQRGGGAAVAYIDPRTGKPQWHKVFSPRGRNPTIGLSASGDAVRLVWFEGGRITTAPLGREGVGPQSKIARVVGEQPPPAIAPGEGDTWFVSWLDFEAGHREPYAVRIRCK